MAETKSSVTDHRHEQSPPQSTERPPGQEHRQPPQPEPLDIWSDWLSQAVTAGSDIAELFRLEVQLALGDARRMLLLALLALPMMMLLWLGFAALMTWLVIDYSGSVTCGLLAFVLLHGAALVSIRLLWQRYKRSLKLPLTRQHLQAFMGGMQHNETQTPEP
ncbi:hypothetical protein G8770_02050 [Aestuariicella hydrocarbonica]|uniref:Uncharacterized protein n=1 Tax=Pseudomaricurvus hydrocarbonicus TaxID=1470433 RepID=A0A9E5MJ10_9GAMM|nr:hypothetical protein [Aestuariicella hydrocarbonica]NHO64329.1 hypothetical protein [Aestuariicella hydrocarbonica]